MKDKGITYDEAAASDHLPGWRGTDREAVDVVLGNYADMTQALDAYAATGKIGSDGEILVQEGTHRSIINITKGFDRTPIWVADRHPEWLKVHDFFKAEAELLYNGKHATYHKILHPDFDDYAVIREDRSKPILHWLGSRFSGRARGVDVGSMVGFYSHTLALAGYDMHAIEYEVKYAEMFRKLARVYGSKATVENNNLFKVDFEKYDFVIMLSIVYHLIRNDEKQAIAFIEKLKTKTRCFIIDTEERTGILMPDKLKTLFRGYKMTSLYRGSDDREIFAIHR